MKACFLPRQPEKHKNKPVILICIESTQQVQNCRVVSLLQCTRKYVSTFNVL